MKVQHYLFLFWIVLAGLLNACKSKSEGDLTDGKTSQLGDLVLAESRDVMAQTIGAQGGELEVKDPQSPLNGFKISVPAGAYSSAVSFSVSAAEVVKHSFGNEYKVLSPLISIEGPSGYIDDFATIEVPIALPKDHFAVAVFINEEGKPELMPTISLTGNKILVATNSFLPATQSSNARTASMESLQLFIMGMNETMLMEADYSTGFKPGEDDWAFINRGSYAAPEGYCNGAVTSALWYFENKKEESRVSLSTIGRPSNSPKTLSSKKLMEGNSLGIKLASVVQTIDGTANPIWDIPNVLYNVTVRNTSDKPIRDHLSFLFASAYLKITSRPLFMALGTFGIGSFKHMVLIAGKNKNKLLICDPNYPGITRSLEYTMVGGFGDLVSGEIAGIEKKYDLLLATAPFLFNKEKLIEEKWIQFENESIGNKEFPKFQYLVSTSQETKPLQMFGNIVNGIFEIKVTNERKLTLFDSTGTRIDKTLEGYKLPLGKHKVGVLVEKEVVVKGENRQMWADFQWFDIEIVKDNYPNCQITTPEGLSVDKAGEVEKQYTFSLGSNCSLPAKTLFFWDFGDGTTTEAVDNPIARHTFTKSGDFTVKLRLLPDGAADYIIRETKVRIGQPDNTSPEYFTYKMNGVAFSDSDPDSEYINSPPNEGLYLDDVNGAGKAYKVLKGDGWDTIYYRIYLGVMPSEWKGVGSYELTKFEKGKIANATAVVGGPGKNVISDSGTLTITRKDNLWIEGTFNFKAGSYNVTEGKFRIKF